MVTQNDQSLIAAAQTGDVRAFEELIRRYERRAYSLAYRLMGNHADAADVLQETLIRVYRGLPAFQGRSAFSSWLHRVVTNTALDRLRRRHHNCISLEFDWEQEQGSLLQRIPADEGDPGVAAERSEVKALVHRALQELPDEYRTVILLRDLQGYSYAEIEAHLGCKRAALKSRLHRARKSLRRQLQETCALHGPTGDDAPAWNNGEWRQAL